MTRKLLSTCISCKMSLSRQEMEAYLELCETACVDPLSAPNGGIRCNKCMVCSRKEQMVDMMVRRADRRIDEIPEEYA